MQKCLYHTINFNWSKLNAYADNRINTIVEHRFVLRRVENIVGKGENAG